MATIAPNMQPSFYYMLMAQACVQRSRAATNHARAQALQDAARDFLVKARVSAGRADTMPEAL